MYGLIDTSSIFWGTVMTLANLITLVIILRLPKKGSHSKKAENRKEVPRVIS